ncbi:MAG: hypothetical protein LBN20_04960 [Endomicrobium sp.]|jgi:hypothetical protein|nr:hypothetical protein [Endomicrobium sp.]
MPLLQINDCPEYVYNQISSIANRQNRTIEQQTIIFLKRGLDKGDFNREKRKVLFEKIMLRNIPKQVRAIDEVQFVREDRNR